MRILNKENADLKQEFENQNIFLNLLNDFSSYNEAIEKNLTEANLKLLIDYKYKLVKILSHSQKFATAKMPTKYVLQVKDTTNEGDKLEEYPILLKKGDDLRKDSLMLQAVILVGKVILYPI